MATEPTVTIPFVMLGGYPVEGLDRQGRFTATVKLRCAWKDRLVLALQLRGGWIDDSNNVMLPAPYLFTPPYGQSPADYARCQTVEVRPWFDAQVNKDWALSVGTASFATYQYAELTVTYGIDWESYTQTGQRRITRHAVDFSGEVLACETDDASKLYYASDHSEVSKINRPNTILANAAWTLTVENIGRGLGDAGLDGQLQLNMGHVNSTPILDPFLPYHNFVNYAEQVLYMGAKIEPFFSPDGQRAWTATLNFAVKVLPLAASLQGGWNHFFKPGGAVAERMTTDAAGTTNWLPFPLVDLQAMLVAICQL